MEKRGFVYLVGAGPGDASYITVKGMELLGTCDVVIYDRLACAGLLLDTKSDCRKIYVGKKPGMHAMKQEEINRVIIEEAGKGKVVVRLKGGDPFVFGRGGEEIKALEEASISYEVVPGITSAIAVPMAAGIPVTHRGASQSFHVITGHTADGEEQLTDNYQALANCNGTLVFLMGLSNLEKIIERLTGEGMQPDTDVAVIEQGTTVYQRCIRGTLQNIKQLVEEAQLHSPVVIVIGRVAALEMKQPEKKIGVTGTSHFVKKVKQAVFYGKHSTDLQPHIFEYPYVDVITRDKKEVEDTIEQIDTYQWIAFTSANGVRSFFRLLQNMHFDRRRLATVRFAVIGEGTAKVLEEYGYYADLMPEQYYAKDLGKALADAISQENKEARVLLARTSSGSRKLLEELDRQHIAYTDIAVYETGIKEEVLLQAIESLPYLDGLTFASASGVRFLCQALEQSNSLGLLSKLDIVCIGRETEAELKRFGIQHSKIATQATVEGMAELLCISL